ncbi:hypothetical protein ZWY2020_041598 [Hordeum vulgare]|nr:hypothetical protein ZWY2020_041598 [Hordeum vulgare]
MMMDMGDGVFLELNAREVAKATGLPPGGRKVDIRAGQCLADREVLLAKVHAILGTDMPRSNSIPVYKVKKIVQSASKDAIQGDERTAMKVAIKLLASSTFLVPRGATTKIANELLPVVAEPDNIAEFDFCDYVVEGLRVAARKLREDLSMDAANVKLEGCLIVPQLGDVPRSPAISVPGSCSQAVRAQAVVAQMVGHASGSRSAAGPVDMDNLPLLPTKVVEAFKATMEFHYKRFARDLAAISREAAKSMMELDVCAQHSADAGASCSHGLPNASTKGQPGIVEGSYSAAHDWPGGEPLANLGSKLHDKCMVVDLKCKGIATGAPRPTRQQTMHELLPPAPNVEAAAPNAYHEPMIDTSFLYLMTEAVIPAEEYFAQEEEYGFSPFELELSHADLYPDHVCQNFYEDFIYLSCAKSLSSTWYKSSSPTILVMDGHKLKYQFSLGGAMFHNGMEAWVRGFNEREKKMFGRVGLPVSRGLLSPDVPLHMENTWNREAPSMLRSLMSTSSLGYALRLCRMIMVPVAFDRDWCLYVFDKLLKCLSVLDPIFTGMAKEDYRDKHGVTIDYMLKGMKYVGEMLDDGWSMHIPDWGVKYNINMHLACPSGESPGYIAYYADNFNGTRLEEDIPRAGLASRRKRMLYETLAAQCNTAPRAGFMVQVAEEI